MPLTSTHCSKPNSSCSAWAAASHWWAGTSIVTSPRGCATVTVAPSKRACRRAASSVGLGAMSAHALLVVAEIGAAADLLLQLQDAVHQRFGGRRAARDVDVDRHDPVAAADHRVGIVVI